MRRGKKKATARAGIAGLEERAAELAERAEELAERIRSSEALVRAQETVTDLTHRARERLHEAGLDERAAELATRLREAEAVQQAGERAAEATDRGLGRLGSWLATGALASKLGVQPAQRRRVPGWLLGVLGVGVGYGLALWSAKRNGELERRAGMMADELETIAERAAQDSAEVAAPPSQQPLADKIRTRLGEDPRTAGLPRLNINVAEGTVFIRGAVPADANQEAIREVVADVPGVKDVDLQLTVSTG